jgi:glycosyltransferase involved in cell wall biosynthesis
MEIPVVASRLPTGITDVTIDGETGILVPPGDPEALARAIQRLLTDRDLTARLGRAGRAHALKHFTFDIFRQRFERVFQALLAGRRIEGPLKSVSSNADVPARPWAQGDHTQPGIVP